MTSKNLIKNPRIARSGSTRAASSYGTRFSVGTGVYSAANEFLREVEALKREHLSLRELPEMARPRDNNAPVRPIASFHTDSRYGGDPSLCGAKNWMRCHVWGGFASFHWLCFGEYVHADSEQQVENVVWKASSNRDPEQADR